MNIAVAVFADFVETFLGHPSRLSTPLVAPPIVAGAAARPADRTILEHTLRRALRIEGASRVVLVTSARDAEVAQAALRAAGLQSGVELAAVDDGRRPRRALLRSARKWNLSSWRGGLLGATWFDEFADPTAVARVIDHLACDGVLVLDGHMAALDPELASRMIEYQIENEAEAPFVFTQAPPGLAGVLLRPGVLRDLLRSEIPLGLLLTYRPEMSGGDLITRPACLQVEPRVAECSARLTADTRRAGELLATAFSELGEDADAAALCAWSERAGHDRPGPMPIEIEIELTTEDPLPETTLLPRGARVPRRVLSDLSLIDRIAGELAEYDDRLIVLAGCGDPLLHPDFPDVCRRIRAAGVCGLAVETALLDVPPGNLEALFDAKVDVVQVRLDATTRETYARVQGADRFDEVIRNLEWLEQQRRTRCSPQPLLVPTLTRHAATLSEMEEFFDRWIHLAGSAVLRGYDTFGGMLPPDSLLPVAPPVRERCRRLSSRLVIYADAQVPLCSRYTSGEVLIGTAAEGVRAVWAGARLAAARAAQPSNLTEFPLCQGCSEWFRP